MALLHLIEQVLIAGMPGREPCRMDVLIEGDKFAAIAPRIDVTSVSIDERTDGREKLLTPGLINAHHHSHDRFDKGRFSGLPLEIWMGLYNPPTQPRQWEPRDVYLRTLLNGIEMLRGGITTVVDDIHFGAAMTPEIVHSAFQAYSDLGMRADICVAWTDRPFHESIPYLSKYLPQDVRQVMQRWHSADIFTLWEELARAWNGRVRFVFSPSAPARCTTPFLQKTWELARKYDRPVMIHVLETRIQALTAQKMYGQSMVAYMDENGLLDEHSVLAHGVWLDRDDIALIARAGASVVHNPACNFKLGSGVAPVAAMLEAGVNVALGTDNNNGNDLNSMLDAMRLATFSGSIASNHAKGPIDADRALQLATSRGAHAIGREQTTGSIEVGLQADFLMFDLNASAFLPLNNVVEQLVFCEQGQSIHQVYVGGRCLIDRGRVTRIDEVQLRAELTQRLPAIMSNMHATTDAATTLRPALEAAYDECLADPAMRQWRALINSMTDLK